MPQLKLVVTVLSFASMLFVSSAIQADQNDTHKTVGGIDIYIGVIPAEVIQGRGSNEERRMHGGASSGGKGYHLVVALFDRESGDRITDSQVKVRVSVPGWVDVENRLEPMKVADAVTFGNYFVLSDLTLNWISVQVQRAGKDAVKADFQYSTGRE
ncbi:MAG TPA: hypothetical protein P5329_07990 [Candidatus Competibacteraceae bacterium]|nr:hypothetical protein [Candidatus Competibacteraceae bacterium]HRX71099.1 hypothetical protein [Candidatus Competibacteraceae bacterium]